MQVTILGSAGNIPIPRPLCNCNVCQEARSLKNKHKRCLASLYIDEIRTLIDCPEDIGESLNLNNITEIDNVFLTHWHPDHTFGFRLIVQAYYDFIFDRPKKQIKFYMPKSVYETLKKNYPAIKYFIEEKKMGKLVLIEDKDIINLGEIEIEVVGHDGASSENYAYLIKKADKRILYAPCDTISLSKDFFDLDILIHEQGYFSPEITWEISSSGLIDRLKRWKPKRTILTHISEDEIKRFGWHHFEKFASDFSLEYAYDGMKVVV
jgi:phosphoribosyl 1,2-cyclic phosphate phosphodiesterase